MMLGIVLLLFAVGVGYGAVVGQRVWNARLEQQAAIELRLSNERRTTSQYANVKVPLKGAKCIAYSFDNKEGGFFNEREALCDPPAPPNRAAAGRRAGRRGHPRAGYIQRFQEAAVVYWLNG